jgi:GT2 family glycosyltransferase
MNDVYYIYGDDIDWCYRFQKHGWKNLFTPDPKIIHHIGATTAQKPKVFRLQRHGSELIFLKLYRSRVVFYLARLLIAMNLSLRIPYWLLKALLKKNERENAINNADTYFSGALFCLVNWKKLLMNQDTIEEKLKNNVGVVGVCVEELNESGA